MTDSRQDLLVEYVATAMEHIERGEPIDLESICREHPELVPAVAAAIAQSRALPKMLGQSDRQSEARMLTPRYRLDERIGAGAMGVVYRATDLDLRRTVAIKLLRSDLFDEPTAAARFAREAEALAALDHPNIVAVFDRGTTEDGTAFLVMEFIAGQSLTRLLAERNTRSTRGNASDLAAWVRQSVQWTVELAQALHVAHEKGILHRDIKPSNILVDGHGRARLLDFGIAAQSGQATLTATRDGTLGTPAYMAPEQLAERVRPAPTADVYSLTATLYHLLTGRPPYLGTASQVLARMQRSDPTPLHKVEPGAPRDLVAIVDKGMARSTSHRYASMDALAADLRAFLDYRAVSARPTSTATRLCRHAMRSPAVRTMAVIALIGMAALTSRAISDATQRRRAADAQSAAIALAPSVTLESAAARRMTDPDELRVHRAVIDRLVANSSDPVWALNLRAAFRADQLDFAGAATDARQMAQGAPTPTTAAVAQAYATAHSQNHTVEIESAQLPTPTDAADRYLHAYYMLRRDLSKSTFESVLTILAHPDCQAHSPSRDLITFAHIAIALALAKVSPHAAIDEYQRALSMADRCEAERGYRTATSAYQIATALLGLREYERARPLLTWAHEQSPYSPQILFNVAVAHQNCGDLDASIAACERLQRMRPKHPRAWITLARIHVDAGEHDAARSTIAAAPFPADAAGAVAAAKEQAQVELLIALDLDDQEQFEPARQAAARALQLLESCGATSTDDARTATALAEGDNDALFSLLAETAVANPRAGAHILGLARYLPNEPSRQQLDELRATLRAVGEALTPGRRRRSNNSPANPEPRHR